MSTTITFLSEWTSDAVLFPILQVGVVVFALFAVLRDWFQARKVGRGGASLQVARGDTSMGRFYGIYATMNGLFVAVSLTVDIANNHRVFWVIVDTVLIAYVCLFNPWCRNLLLLWAEKLTKIEKR